MYTPTNKQAILAKRSDCHNKRFSRQIAQQCCPDHRRFQPPDCGTWQAQFSSVTLTAPTDEMLRLICATETSQQRTNVEHCHNLESKTTT